MSVTDHSLVSVPIGRVYGLCECSFRVPTESDNSLVESCVRNAKVLGPLLHGPRLPLKGKMKIACSIVGLLFCSAPSAVERAIGSVVINPVNRGTLGAVTHVIKKHLKGISPCGAYNDSTTTIPVPSLVLWVHAAILHERPNTIGSCFSLAVGNRSYEGEFCAEAAAALRVAVAQIPVPNSDGISAVAPAHPGSPSFAVGVPATFALPKNDQSTKSPSCQIEAVAIRTANGYDAVRHAFLPMQETVLEQPPRAVIPTGCLHFMGAAA